MSNDNKVSSSDILILLDTLLDDQFMNHNHEQLTGEENGKSGAGEESVEETNPHGDGGQKSDGLKIGLCQLSDVKLIAYNVLRVTWLNKFPVSTNQTVPSTSYLKSVQGTTTESDEEQVTRCELRVTTDGPDSCDKVSSVIVRETIRANQLVRHPSFFMLITD